MHKPLARGLVRTGQRGHVGPLPFLVRAKRVHVRIGLVHDRLHVGHMPPRIQDRL